MSNHLFLVQWYTKTSDGKGEVSRDIHDESRWPTKVHGELNAASVQLQSQGVR